MQANKLLFMEHFWINFKKYLLNNINFQADLLLHKINQIKKRKLENIKIKYLFCIHLN